MVINQEKCTGCGACVEACPNGAISLDGGVAVIDQAECSSCQVCADVCPEGALQFSKETVPATLQKIDTGEIIQPVTTIASLQKPANWSAIALSLVGRYVLHRVVDILASFLEQR
jgi:Fe-S-cluster-containing hydrogenase component 2